MPTRNVEKQRILEAVRAMAVANPSLDYATARDIFGLLGVIKTICGNAMPTARQCWEHAGLHRSSLVDEFEFTQTDIANRKPMDSL